MVKQIIANSRAKLTLGQRVSDFCARLFRSWGFIVCQLIFIAIWIILNASHITHFDNPSYDILKLILVIESSFMGSMILMSHHRQSNMDRKLSYQDYVINWGSKKELDQILPLIKEDHAKILQVLEALQKNDPSIDKLNKQ